MSFAIRNDRRGGRAVAGPEDVMPDEFFSPVLLPVEGAAEEARRAEILIALDALDAASARPLRSIVAGTATEEDRARLVELEGQAATLRAELAELEAPPAPTEPTP